MATEYIVLKKNGDGWEPIKNAGGVEYRKAASAKAAISASLGGSPEAGEYVAVPARSWNPVKVQVDQALKFST